jgi:hypothetical protein
MFLTDTSKFNDQFQLHQHHHNFTYHQICIRRMSSAVIENLPSEILLQICELLRDTHKASLVSLSETIHKVRKVAAMVLFQRVMLPVQNHDSVGETVRQLCDTLGPISALDHIRTLRLCKHPSSYNKETLRYPWDWHRSDMASAEVAWTYDHAYKPVVDLLQRCPILLDLIYELEHQLAPCVLAALHQYRPDCRLHLRTFCVRSLMEPELDKHELALASSPCLRSIWFSYMEPEENDYYASRSQRVVQQVIARLASNVEEVRFRRIKLGSRGNPRWQDTELPMNKDSPEPSTRVRRLIIHSGNVPGSTMVKEELESWYKHVDFSLLHTLVLSSPLDHSAQLRLHSCNLSSLRALTFNFIAIGLTDSPFARSFITSLPPLSELAIRGIWDLHDMTAVYQRHGASLHKLGFCLRGLPAVERIAAILTEMRDQCPLLTELEINIPRDQGSLTEMAIYNTLTTFPILRRLTLYLGSKNYDLVREQGRMAPYDSFDRQRSGRYGDIRRSFIDRAIDEKLAATIFRLISPPDRVRGLKEPNLIGCGISHPYGTRSSTYEVISHICRSWKVQRGVRDDRPDEVVIQEVIADPITERKPAPKDLPSRVEKIFRHIWPGSEDGTSDWRTDWHGILQLDGDDVTA